MTVLASVSMLIFHEQDLHRYIIGNRGFDDLDLIFKITAGIKLIFKQ